MTRALRLLLIAILACIIQTTIVGYFRIIGVAPDMMIAFLAALTRQCGSYGGFCMGSVMAMFYDASVGYALAINLVGYTFIGWFAPSLREHVFGRHFRKLKHKSYLEMFFTGFFLTMMREILYIGYLFLIGSEQNLMTLIRMLVCCGYTGAMVIPADLIIRRILRKKKKKQSDLIDDDTTASQRTQSGGVDTP